MRYEMAGVLPCGVLRSVECGSGALGMDVEYVLAAEGVGVGVVLIGAESPFGGAGHGVDGDAAKELDLFVLYVDAVDQGFKVRGIAEAVGLDLHGSFVGGVFVAVDGFAHLPEVPAEFALLFAFDLESGYGDSRGGENCDDGHADDEFDQGEAGFWVGCFRVGQALARRAYPSGFSNFTDSVM